MSKFNRSWKFIAMDSHEQRLRFQEKIVFAIVYGRCDSALMIQVQPAELDPTNRDAPAISSSHACWSLHLPTDCSCILTVLQGTPSATYWLQPHTDCTAGYNFRYLLTAAAYWLYCRVQLPLPTDCSHILTIQQGTPFTTYWLQPHTDYTAGYTFHYLLTAATYWLYSRVHLSLPTDCSHILTIQQGTPSTTYWLQPHTLQGTPSTTYWLQPHTDYTAGYTFHYLLHTDYTADSYK